MTWQNQRTHDLTIKLTPEEYERVCQMAAEHFREPEQEAAFVLMKALEVLPMLEQMPSGRPPLVGAAPFPTPLPNTVEIPLQASATVHVPAPVPPGEEYTGTFDEDESGPVDDAPKFGNGYVVARVAGSSRRG